MKRLEYLIIIIFVLFNIALSFGAELEKVNFDAPENSAYSISLFGFFSKSGIANPNDTIFSYMEEHKQSAIPIVFFNQYKFLGRTGEKTFEILSIEQGPGGVKASREKLNIYFDDTVSYPLRFISINTNCSLEDKILLKMIKLQGNQLEYQIILPNCLAGRK
jgi:hypothetical protein